MNSATEAFFLLGGDLPKFTSFRDEKKRYLLIKENELIGLLDENLEKIDRLEAITLIRINPNYVYPQNTFMGIRVNI